MLRLMGEKQVVQGPESAKYSNFVSKEGNTFPVRTTGFSSFFFFLIRTYKRTGRGEGEKNEKERTGNKNQKQDMCKPQTHVKTTSEAAIDRTGSRIK